MLLISFGIWLTIMSNRLTVLGKNYPECWGIEKFNTFVASKISCARYIFCDGENSFEGECLGNNVFNEKEGNCDDPTVVVCNALNSGNVNNGNGANNGNISGNDIDIDNNSVLNPNNGNHESHGSPEREENNPLIDNAYSSTMLPALPPYFNGPQSGISNPPIVPHFPIEILEKPQCPLDSDQTNLIHLPNPASCASYYTCYNGIAIPMICGRNMYFNAQSGKCEPQEQVYCALDRPVRLECSKGIYDFLPHPRNCDYYYFCSNGFLMIFQCPFKFTWHYERRTCVHQSQSKCFSSTILQQRVLA